MRKEKITWKLQAGSWAFGFVIPDDRDYWGWDFFVNKKDFNWAKDWDKVEAQILEKAKWKKPEAKITMILWWEKKEKKSDKAEVLKTVEWIYSSWEWNFWFVDVEWQEKWFFVYWKKKYYAKDWDKVRAEVVEFNWKEEAIVVEVLEQEEEVLEWTYRDNERFWFVIPDDSEWDIFIAWSRKNWAREWDKVIVKIIKRRGKNPEGVIKEIL